MPIRKAGERVKGTTRVSFGDRKLMTRLWKADKTSRFEKRRETRALNKKEKEAFEQCPTHRGKKGFQSFLKDLRGAPKQFELPEDEEDPAALDAMSRMGWFMLMHRHRALMHDEHVVDTFVRESLRGTKGRNKLANLDPFAQQLYADFGETWDEKEDALPKSTSASAKLIEGHVVRPMDAEVLPLLYGRRNMRLMHQYRRLTKRHDQSAETVTASSSHALTHHMFHGAQDRPAERFAFASETSGNKRKRSSASDQEVNYDIDDGDYAFATGGVNATDAAWPLIDGNAAPPRPFLQPTQWYVAGDSVIDALLQKTQPSTTSSSSSYSDSTGQPATNRRRRSSRYSRSTSSSGDVGGFGFADEAQHRQFLRSEQRRNGVLFRHAYEVERQANLWTTCQRCRAPVHTCDMVVRESIGVEDVSCFHPECLDAVKTAHKEQRQTSVERGREVAQFTPLTVSDNDGVRSAVNTEIQTPIIEIQQRRAAFLRERAQRERETTEARKALGESEDPVLSMVGEMLGRVRK